MRKMFSGLAMAIVGSASLMATSIAYPSRGIVAPAHTFTAATSGEEVAYFYGSTAGYKDMIGVWVNGTQLGSFGLNNHTSAFGDTLDFGHVNAGDTIVFALEVMSKGYTVYSDPSMNSDGINHTYTTDFTGASKNSRTIPAGTFVSFEDLLMPGSDLNFNDENVVFSNLTATLTATPEPASILLLGLGLVGTAFGIRRKVRS